MNPGVIILLVVIGIGAILYATGNLDFMFKDDDDDAGGGSWPGPGPGDDTESESESESEDDEYIPVYGESVTCKTNAPGGKGSDAVFHATVNEDIDIYLLRHYPTDAIAASWDPNWKSAKEIKDCTKYEAGVDMKMKHPLLDIDPNLSVSCKKNNMDGRGPDTIYQRSMRLDRLIVDPDPPAAADVQIEDCTGVNISDDPNEMPFPRERR
jgi:hypothetical protein